MLESDFVTCHFFFSAVLDPSLLQRARSKNNTDLVNVRISQGEPAAQHINPAPAACPKIETRKAAREKGIKEVPNSKSSETATTCFRFPQR